MNFQTAQGHDLTEHKDRIDLELGTYKDEPEIYGAQRRLYDLLKEDQLVWCQKEVHRSAGEYVHEIDVDPRDLIAIVDALIWCHILDYGPRYILSEDHANLRHQARIESPENNDATLRTLEDDYLAANLPDGLWCAVLKPEITKNSDQLLVKFPFEFSTIVSVELV